MDETGAALYDVPAGLLPSKGADGSVLRRPLFGLLVGVAAGLLFRVTSSYVGGAADGEVTPGAEGLTDCIGFPP